MIEASRQTPSSSKTLTYVLIGAAFWFVAAMGVRLMGTAVLNGGWSMALLFALTLPFGWLSMRLIGALVGLRGAAFLAPVLTMTVTALILDGLAFTWTDLYGLPLEARVYGAAWILFGAGVIGLFALLDARAPRD